MTLKFWMPTLSALLFSCPVIGQQIVDHICMEVIGSNGLSSGALGKKYEATLGECMISTFKPNGSPVGITQGFHQPECSKTMVHTDEAMMAWEIELYPNPVVHQFQLAYVHPAGAAVETRIWNASSQLMADWRSTPPNTVLDGSPLAAGLYFLEIKDPETGHHLTIRFTKTPF